MRTTPALLLILVTLSSSLLLIPPASPQVSPDIPNFTLHFSDDSYWMPKTSTTDPQTGTVTTYPRHYVDQRFIEVTIQNPTPYAFYAVVNESIVRLYYNIRFKEHSQNWTYATVSQNLAPSTTQKTTVLFGVGAVNPNPGGWSIWLGDFPVGSQVDFQVRGVDGFYTNLTDHPPCWRLPQFNVFNETGESPWSQTQTITIPASSTNQSTTLQIGYNTFTLAIAVVSVAGIGTLAYWKKHPKNL